MKFRTLASAFAGMFFVAGPVCAGILYDNGAINGTQASGAPTISASFVSDSFVLSSASTITGTANLGLWILHGGATPVSVSWSVNTSPYSGVLSAGTATFSSSVLFTNAFNYDIFSSSFSLPSLPLAAGTYWLELGNAVSSNGSSIYWDRTGGPSKAFDAPGVPDISTMSFQILGNQNVTAVSEPTSALLTLGALGAMAWRQRRFLRGAWQSQD